MTAKEKAKELVGKYEHIDIKILFIPSEIECKIKDLSYSVETAKQCALIAVDLAIELNDFHLEFLYEVKQEIEKL
jgi:hypothetical protein